MTCEDIVTQAYPSSIVMPNDSGGAEFVGFVVDKFGWEVAWSEDDDPEIIWHRLLEQLTEPNK